MGPAARNFGRRLAALCSRRRSRRGWIALIISSESLTPVSDIVAIDIWVADDLIRRGMQECFRAHPEDYPDELANPGPEDGEEPALGGAVDAAVDSIAEDVPVSNIPALSDSLPVSSSLQPLDASTTGTASKEMTPPPQTLSSSIPSDASVHPAHTTNDNDQAKTERAEAARDQVRRDHETGGQEELVPKEWHDTRQKTDGK